MIALRILLALSLSAGAVAQENGRPALVERLQQEALAYVEANSAGLPGARTFRVLRAPLMPQLRPGEVRFEPSHLSKQDASGPFFVSFKILLDGRPAGTARVDLEGRWTGKVLKTRVALPRKGVPGPEDLEEVDFVGTLPAGAILSFPDGFRLKTPLPAGHLLTQLDLQAIPVVNAGESVRVELVCGALTVSSEGIARNSAAVGEKVRVELPSRKPMQALVTGPGQARVAWVAEPGRAIE